MLFSPRSPSPRTAAAANIVSKHKRGSAAIKRTLVRQKHLRCDYPSFGSLRASSLHHRARCAVAQFDEAPLGTQLSCGRSLVQQTHRCDPRSVGAFAFLPRRLDGRAWHRKHNVTFSWVKGHANNIENERCDALAVSASENPVLEKDVWYEKSKKDNLLF